MTLGHHGTQISASEFARLLFPHLDPHKAAAALALVPVTAHYSETEEAEAETFASLLLERIQGTALALTANRWSSHGQHRPRLLQRPLPALQETASKHPGM